MPRLLDPLAGALGVAIFVLVVYAGFAGSQTTTNNLAPTVIFYVFWVGLAVVSPIFGDVFKALNPWRAAARAVAWVAAKVSKGGLPAPMAYPAKLGHWPAAIGLLAFTWVELVYSGRGDPSNLAVLALVYVAVQFVGMSLYGIETWNRYGDAFGVFFGLFARISPLHWTRAGLHRPQAAQRPDDARPGAGHGRAAVRDHRHDVVRRLLGRAGVGRHRAEADRPLPQHRLRPGDGARARVHGRARSAPCSSSAACTGSASMGMHTVTPQDTSTTELARRFVHTLVPIGLAYVVAHYFSALGDNGQRMAYLVSDPLGTGANYFGTNDATVNYSWISANAIWYVQVAALVIGHIAGLVLAHERALKSFSDSRVATRSQYWMLVVMIAFTSLGLWLLSAANS